MTSTNHPTTEKLLSELQEKIERDRRFIIQAEVLLAWWREHLRDVISCQRGSEAAGVSTTRGLPA